VDDFSIWWYLIAAVIYFLTRGRKKKKGSNQPQNQNRPKQTKPTKSFDELLKEITEGTFETETEEKEEEKFVEESPKVQVPSQKPIESKRRFADEESRRVYEESIKMAEGADLEFEPDDDYKKPSLFKKYSDNKNELVKNSSSLVIEIRAGLQSKNSAKKAVIYSEILSRKY